MRKIENVFILHHTYGDSENETYKLLGVFESEQKATEAIDMFRTLPGFRKFPDGFSVDAYRLNEVSWAEGFGIDQIDQIWGR